MGVVAPGEEKNFSKEQYVLPEDDLRIEIFRSVLNVLV